VSTLEQLQEHEMVTLLRALADASPEVRSLLDDVEAQLDQMNALQELRKL